MTRFVVHLSNKVSQFVWAFTMVQANEHARNLASYYKCSIVSVEEV